MNSMLPKTPRSSSRARGGAMVEFVVLNIVLIPLFLYAIFLMDAAYLKLDLQETVVAGTWDFSQRTTEPPAYRAGSLDGPVAHDTANSDEVAATEKAIRVTYADHTSAYNDGADTERMGEYGDTNRLRGNGDGSAAPSVSGHQKHHTGFGAQYTFQFEGAEDTQFHCSLSSDMGWTPDPLMTGFANSNYNVGGEARCEAKGYIYNYIIPETFLQEFSQVNLTRMKQRKDTTAKGTHEYQATAEGVNDVNQIIAFETASISFNTWALRNGAKNSDSMYNYNGSLSDADLRAPPMPNPIPTPLPMTANSPEANPFYRRVQFLYAGNSLAMASYANIAGNAMSLASRASSEKLMMMTPHTLPVSPIGPIMSGNLLPNIAGVHLTARYKPQSPGEKQSTPGLFGGQRYLSTPYTGPNNDYQTAYNKRGPHYMGCRTKETPNCF